MSEPYLIVVSGPIGAGKSTLAYELASRFMQSRLIALALELDLVADILRRSNPFPDPLEVWQWARRGAASLAKSLFGSGANAVIVEGDFWWPPGRAEFVASLEGRVEPRFVTLTVSYEEALRRVLRETSRKKSRDPVFLKGNLEAFNERVEDYTSTDLILNSEVQTTSELADKVLSHYRLGLGN